MHNKNNNNFTTKPQTFRNQHHHVGHFNFSSTKQFKTSNVVQNGLTW